MPRAERDPNRARLGRRGERIAARHLEDRGYRVLARNWRVRRYEIDLVVERTGVVAFVEVKTRTRGPQSASEALTIAQMRRIRRAAEAWIHAHPGIGTEFRFDLVSVDVGRTGEASIDHVEDAFFAEHAG